MVEKRIAKKGLGTMYYIPPEFPLVLDGIRPEDEDMRLEIDDILKELFVHFGASPIILRGSIQDRVNIILQHEKLAFSEKSV